jgi:hypothetical protein
MFHKVSTPPGRGGHFKLKSLSRKGRRPLSSQPLPAGEVISRNFRTSVLLVLPESQPLPAGEVISRSSKNNTQVKKRRVSTPPGRGGHFKRTRGSH